MELKSLVLFLTLFLLNPSKYCNGKLLKHHSRIVNISRVPTLPNPSFVSLNRSKKAEPNTPPQLTEYRLNKNVVLSKLLDKRNQKLALVASGTVVFAVTCYKFVSKILNYYLYERYAVKNSPGIVNTIGHVLLKNTPYVPSKTFMDKAFKPVLMVLENTPFLRGLVRPGMERVSTSSVIQNDTIVLVYIYDELIHQQSKKYGFDYMSVVMSKYESLKKSGKKVELVLVNLSNKWDMSYDTFKGLPCYSVPFGNKNLKHKIANMLGPNSIPTLFLLDSQGNVISDNCLYLLYKWSNNFPWPNVKFMDYLPDKLYNSSNEPVPKSSLYGKIVGVYLDSGNPEVSQKLRTKLKELYEFMNKATDGNFELVTLKYCTKRNEFDDFLKGNHPSWLNLGFDEVTTSVLLVNTFGMNEFVSNVVLLDQQGDVYTKFGMFALDKNLHQSLLNGLLKGAVRVKDGELAHCHLMNRPIIVVLADKKDPKGLEDLTTELNKAFLAHKRKRRGQEFEFLVLNEKKPCEQTRKFLRLDDKTLMIAVSPFNKLLKFKGGELNETSVLKFIDDYYNSF
uniref:Thioredoxin-like, putative n=1 Tax=Theileria annulata TaxID=5874 RepID=A0A3B0MZS5_THEAN